MTSKDEITKFILKEEDFSELQKINGFPFGVLENHLSLSYFPYYTSFPNPWIKLHIRKWDKNRKKNNTDYRRIPFAFDVSEGKANPIYNIHTYHTKVPYKAIMRYILHYTNPGDIIYDGFCGTGMTGVAATLCNSLSEISHLGYKIDTNGHICNHKGQKISKMGRRHTILNDLSPIATFIAYNYNTFLDTEKFETEFTRIIEEVKHECSWLLETDHVAFGKKEYFFDLEGRKKEITGTVNYTVWSDVFICPNCTEEFIYWNEAFDESIKKIKKEFNCPHCQTLIKRRELAYATEITYDDGLSKTAKSKKTVPVLINYEIFKGITGKHKRERWNKKPDGKDVKLIKELNNKRIPYWFPNSPILFKGSRWGDTWRAGYHTGMTHTHHFYTKRNLWIASCLFDKIQEVKEKRIRQYLLFAFTSIQNYINKKQSFTGGGGGVSGTLYVPSFHQEKNVISVFERKCKNLKKCKEYYSFFKKRNNIVSTGSADRLQCPNDSIDYIFIDPPFGENLMYSELNFIWEDWLKVYTNNSEEAIINNSQNKGLEEYQKIMENCFKEFYRILKPGRWMTIEFHNSKNSVWMAIQEALSRAGFIVADVRTLDKKQGTFKQVTTTSAVKQDLIISTYKPFANLEELCELKPGNEEIVWEFLENHLLHLPIFLEQDNEIERLLERQDFLLYDRMIAFHVQRGLIVPISASDFYGGLKERFPERDNMYFLPQQVVEYDRKRSKTSRFIQTKLAINDEKDAVNWIRLELKTKTQTYQEIQPKFIQHLYLQKHEKLPELIEILEENFIKDEDGKWNIPDYGKTSDLERIREKSLIKEFEEYKKTKGKLKTLRIEAIRFGFAESWAGKDFETIIDIGDRLPDIIRSEDPTILMYYDNALTLSGKD